MLNMNDKSKVVNLCDYPVSWERITQNGDEYLKANASAYITNSEIETQKDNGNRFIAGTDGLGSHALVYIENPEMREYLSFDNQEDKRKQLIVDDDRCKELLELKTLSTFKKRIKESIIEIHEKKKIIEVARKMKLNELDKVEFLEEHCGFSYKT